MLVFVVTLALAPCSVATAARRPRPSQGATPRICEVATECPTIDAVAKPTVSEHDILRFLDQLWSVNYEGGPAGTYQLQRCENPGPAPYRIECVLFSSGTQSDVNALKSVFESSRLFQTVDTLS